MSDRKYGVGAHTLERLIGEVVTARAPENESVLDALSRRSLTVQQREALRELLSRELTETGLDDADEPNPRGHLIEAAISWLAEVSPSKA
jgi:hypothetical protein